MIQVDADLAIAIAIATAELQKLISELLMALDREAVAA